MKFLTNPKHTTHVIFFVINSNINIMIMINFIKSVRPSEVALEIHRK